MKSISLEGRRSVPSKIVCVGRNYLDHIVELGNEPASEMVVFSKPNSAIAEELVAWRGEAVHYEGELSFVVEEGGFHYVGFGLDLTKRDLQGKLQREGLPWERCKGFDGSALFSEFVRMDGIPEDLELRLSIGGELRQRGGVANMIYKPTEIFEEILRFMALEDGDVVMTGTPKGVGPVESGARFEGSVWAGETQLVSASWTAL